jgi:aldehyde reductase
MLAAGLTKSIGVSNFNQRQLQKLLNNCKIKPVNLQVNRKLKKRKENHNPIIATAKKNLILTKISGSVVDLTD